MAKITKKVCLETIGDILNAAKDTITLDSDVTYDDLTEYVEKELIALDKKAEQAAKRAKEKKAEGDELRAVVLECVPEGEAISIDAIVEAVKAQTGDPEITRNKVISRLNQLSDKKDEDGNMKGTGEVTQEMVEVQVAGTDKTKKVSGYRRV